MTITVRQKGKKLEDGGGMVITTDMWMAPTIRRDAGADRLHSSAT